MKYRTEFVISEIEILILFLCKRKSNKQTKKTKNKQNNNKQSKIQSMSNGTCNFRIYHVPEIRSMHKLVDGARVVRK